MLASRLPEGDGAVANSQIIADLDARIAVLRENLRELIEQASGYSGAASEELTADRIAQQEEQLAALSKERDALTKRT